MPSWDLTLCQESGHASSPSGGYYLENIQPILDGSGTGTTACTSCHFGFSPPGGLNLTSVPDDTDVSFFNLNGFYPPTSYAQLINGGYAGINVGSPFTGPVDNPPVPNTPGPVATYLSSSYLYEVTHRFSASTTLNGGVPYMPMFAVPLSEATQDAIRTWILDGAPY